MKLKIEVTIDEEVVSFIDLQAGRNRSEPLNQLQAIALFLLQLYIVGRVAIALTSYNLVQPHI